MAGFAFGQRAGLVFVEPNRTERDVLVDAHLVAKNGGFPDHHAGAVVNEKRAPDGGTGVDVDTGG
jgi:hypothetical protein